MAFVAYATGNVLGGGGLIRVYTVGLVLANLPQARGPFGHERLRLVLLSFNTTAEFTMLLLLEQVPRLRDVHPLEAAELATQMEALVAVAVVTSLVLKGVVLPRLLQWTIAPAPPA
jgi:NhaP-type Na+/H+ or K+/H+ antiporter